MPLGYDYIIKCLMIMSMIGMSIKIFFGNDKSPKGDYGSASSTIWGFGLVVLSLITLMFVAYSIQTKFKVIKKAEAIQFGSFLAEFFSQETPSLITILILLWVITLNITFYKRINQGNVADEYFSLTSGSSFLFTVQVICLFIYLNEFIRSKKQSAADTTTSDNSLNRIKFAIYFISIINLMITGMMTIILYLFSTDG